MPHAVNALVLAQQAAAPKPVLDLVGGDAGFKQLSPGDDTVRPRGQPHQNLIHGLVFSGHWPQKATSCRWFAPLPGQ